MKTRTQTANSTPSDIQKLLENQGDFPSWLISVIRIDFLSESDWDEGPLPALKGMLLKDEVGRKRKNPPWSLVEHVIRELDPGYFNSFACLSIRGNNFVQCLRGFNGWHLEWRITNSTGHYVHYRACNPVGSKKPFELKKHNHVSPGQHRDLLNLEDVVGAFFAFHQDQGLPGSLKWRKFDI